MGRGGEGGEGGVGEGGEGMVGEVGRAKNALARKVSYYTILSNAHSHHIPKNR